MKHDEINILINSAITQKLDEIEDELDRIIDRIVNSKAKLEATKEYVGGIMTARNIITIYKNNIDKGLKNHEIKFY